MGYTHGKQWDYNLVKEYLLTLRYYLISDKYIDNKQKLILKDKEGYYYISSLANLLSGRTPNKFHTSNPYTIQNIKLWCEINNKPFELVSNKYNGNNKKLQWKCLNSDCEEIFRANWVDIIAGKGCGFCAGKQVGLSNCLAINNPELAKQWHPTKNGKLTPYDVTFKSGKDVWWQCSKNSKHEWQATINDRNITQKCPYCFGKYATEENNLLVNNPILCEEWDYDKNNNLPDEFLPFSNKSVWWKCKDCGNEWKAHICDRSRINGSSCPECNKSKGEKRVKKYLIENNWIKINQENFNCLLSKYNNKYFIPQKTFNKLLGVGNGSLSYDFYLPKYNLLIEYQGGFHDGTVNYQTKEEYKKQKEHDKRKYEYAQKHNIQLLEIWYWDYDNIEIILENYFKALLLSEVK